MNFSPEGLILLTFYRLTPRKPLFLRHETHRIPLFCRIDSPFRTRLQ